MFEKFRPFALATRAHNGIIALTQLCSISILAIAQQHSKT